MSKESAFSTRNSEIERDVNPTLQVRFLFEIKELKSYFIFSFRRLLCKNYFQDIQNKMLTRRYRL